MPEATSAGPSKATPTEPGWALRPGGEADAGAILGLVRSLAAYEESADKVQMTERQLAEALGGPAPRVRALVAESGGHLVAIAIYFWSFSTWTGRMGLFLEDLFVLPEHRRAGIGRALLSELAAQAVGTGAARLEWNVLDWNEPAIEFYRSLGAVAKEEWTTFRLEGPALEDMAARSRPSPSS